MLNSVLQRGWLGISSFCAGRRAEVRARCSACSCERLIRLWVAFHQCVRTAAGGLRPVGGTLGMGREHFAIRAPRSPPVPSPTSVKGIDLIHRKARLTKPAN